MSAAVRADPGNRQRLDAERAAAQVAAPLADVDLPADPWRRSHAIVSAVIAGGCDNSAAHHLQRFAAGAERTLARRAVAYHLCRNYRIRCHPALAKLPPHVGEAAVDAVADAMLDSMSE